jgi:hypothetical protein
LRDIRVGQETPDERVLARPGTKNQHNHRDIVGGSGVPTREDPRPAARIG